MTAKAATTQTAILIPKKRASPQAAIPGGTRDSCGSASRYQSVAPVVINYTGTVNTTRGVVLMAPGALTHAFDEGQRYVPLQVVSGPADGVRRYG